METFNSYVLFAMIVLPLVGAGIIMMIPMYRPDAVRWTAAAFAFALMLLGFYTFLVYYVEYRDIGGTQFMRTWRWLERSTGL